MIKAHFNGTFKGSRDYLQGGDLYDGAEAAVRKSMNDNAYVKSITFRHMTRESGAYFIGEGQVPDGYVETAQFKIQDGQNILTGIFATDGGNVDHRIEFREDLITDAAKIDLENQSITQLSKTDFTSCEEIVALTKSLHNRLLPPLSGKWIFTALNINGPHLRKNEENFTIKIKQNLAEKMTRSDLFAGDQLIGTIGFTVLES